jgi:hypothetical protein
MRLLLTILLAILLHTVSGQGITTFSRIYGNDSTVSGGTAITSNGDTIYFSMYSENSLVTYQAATIVKTDPAGNTLNHFSFIKLHAFYYGGQAGSLKYTKDGYVVWASDSFTTIPTPACAYFGKFNTSLDKPNIKLYNPIGYSEFYSFAELSDGNYLMAGTDWDSLHSHQSLAWMVKTDTAGNELWQKNMSSDVLNTASFTSPFEGGFYQFWQTYHLNTLSGNPADSAIFVDRYDNNGNLQWRDTFGVVGHDNIPGPFTKIKEGGGAIIVESLDTSNPSNGTNYMPLVAYKFDTNGIILWQHYFPAAPNFKLANSMIETRSGSLVICGGIQSGYVSMDTEGHASGAIFKLDKNGNLIFQQAYNYDSTWSDRLLDITETADGGYACIGNAFENVGGIYYQKAWLLKVDSNGCLNSNCPTLYTGIQPIPDLINFFVFPNPASSQFTVALAGPQDIYQYHNLSFSLCDLKGRLVQKQTLDQQTTIIQRGDLSAGLYVWELSDESGHINSGKISLR